MSEVAEASTSVAADKINLWRKHLMKICTVCGAESYRVESKFCIKCGKALPNQENVPRQNLCINQECDLHKTKFIYPDDARYCDICGSQTAYEIPAAE